MINCRPIMYMSVIGILFVLGNAIDNMIFSLPMQDNSNAKANARTLMAAIDYDNAPFYEYLKDMMGRLGIAAVIMDASSIPDSISLHQEPPASRQDLLERFTDVLGGYDTLLVKKDEVFQIIPYSNDGSEDFEAINYVDQIDKPDSPNRKTIPTRTGSMIRMNFKDLPLDDFLDNTARMLDLLQIEIDPEVHGLVTLYCSSSISKEDAFQVLTAILKNNNAVLIGSGIKYRVISSSKIIPEGWNLVTRLPASTTRQIR